MTRLRVRLPEGLPTPESVSWVLDGAESLCGEGGVANLPPARAVQLILPASRVLLARAVLPHWPQGRLRRLQRMPAFAVEDSLGAEPERVHAVVGPRQDDGSHAVAVVDRAWLSAWRDKFRACGREPQSARVETCLPPLEPGEWIVAWKDGSGFVRSGPASGMALDGFAGDEPPAALTLCLEEARAAGHAPRRVLLRPADAPLPDAGAWSARLGVPCQLGEAWDWRTVPDDQAIEFLQADFAPASSARGWLRLLRPVLALAALILVIEGLGLLVDWRRMDQEKTELRAAMREMFRASFPEARAIADPALQMHRQLLALRRASGDPQPDDMLPLLARVSTVLGNMEADPKAKSIRNVNAGASHDVSVPVHAIVRALAYEQARLRLELDLPGPHMAGALIARLRDAGLKATLESAPGGEGRSRTRVLIQLAER